MNWQEVLTSVVYPALAGILTTILGMVLMAALDWIKRHSSTLKYGQAVGVIADAVGAAWVRKIKPSLAAKLADGRMTPEEWETLRLEVSAEAKKIAQDHLLELRGFAPKNLAAWVEVQVDRALGELIGRVSNGEEETDPLANTPASDQ